MNANVVSGDVSDDERDVMGFVPETYAKRKNIDLLQKERDHVNHLTSIQLKEQCKDDVHNSPKRCRAEYVRQLKRLISRFERTSSFRVAGQAFRDDMQRLEQDMQQVLDAGLSKIHDVTFTGSGSSAIRKRRICSSWGST